MSCGCTRDIDRSFIPVKGQPTEPVSPYWRGLKNYQDSDPIFLYGSGSKPKACNRAGLHSRHTPLQGVCNRQAPAATDSPIGFHSHHCPYSFLNRVTSRNRGYVTSHALQRYVTEGCRRRPWRTGFGLIAEGL